MSYTYAKVEQYTLSAIIVCKMLRKLARNQGAFLYLIVAKKVSNPDADAKIVSRGAGYGDSGYLGVWGCCIV